jgi:diguanylate cyclase (GGDEF)-like protein
MGETDAAEADGDRRDRQGLGWALHARAEDVAQRVLARLGSMSSTASEDPDDEACKAIARADVLATEVLGRWLATGEAASEEEMGELVALGKLGDRLALSTLVKAYLAWRDATFEVLEAEAERLGSSSDLVAEARSSVAQSCDASLVRMARQFDHERHRLEEELATEQAKLAHQALHDFLTGLPNRILLAERLDHALHAAERYGEAVAVLFVDIDGFKAVNDGLGHDAGDRVLEMLAGRIKQVIRPSDTVGRVGGDEFVIVCERLARGEEQAIAVAERALETLRQPCVVEGREVYVSASIGIAVGSNLGDADGVLSNADAAMYAAKKRGGSRYAIYEGAIGQVTARRAALSQDLRRALDRGELHLHYQPITSIGSTTVVSMEALARWEHPTLGGIPPEEFIPLAEQIGLIRAIDEWVLQQACRQAATWRQGGWEVGVSVNVSVRDIDARNLEESVRSVLAETGLRPDALTLEITESRLIGDVDAVVRALAGLSDWGVRVAIDDFGVGYSSLSYLQGLPINAVKVDRSFIHGLESPSQTSAVVAAIVGLAHTLGLSVVAEGVENEQELAEVQRLGCDEVQGFLLAPPRPPEEVRRVPSLDAAA